MKTSFKVFFSGIVLFGSVALLGFGQNVFATAPSFNRVLSIGYSGSDVRSLQEILNRDPATRVAETGLGSTGQETTYFGLLTKEAVIRFQEKYAAQILVPNQLSTGTGFVGHSTLAILNMLSDSAITANEAAASSTVLAAPPKTPRTTLTSTLGTSVATSINPNLRNINVILADIDKIGTQEGLSSSTLAIVHEKVIERLSTTTDLSAKLLSSLSVSKSGVSINHTSFFGNLFASIENFFLPQRAFASAGVPFGGALLGVIPCDVGFNLVIEPLPPTFATLLYYVEGTQLFLSYNIPATTALLGTYIPGGGACVIGLWYVPSEGTITPATGSAPL